MKVYTEIIYEWKDGGLKEISSESFDYEGEVTQCWGMPNISISIPDIDLDPRTSDINLGGGTLGQNLGNIDLDPSTSTLHGLDQPNLGQFGTGQGVTMGDVFGGASYYGDKINREWIGGAMNYLSETAQHISEFIFPSKDPTKVTVPTWESAAQGYAKNKTAAELSANKAKNQARGSLRIDK